MAKAIPLSNGMVAIVDDQDYEKLNRWTWRYQAGSNTGYAIRTEVVNGTKTTIRMHRLVMGAPFGVLVDHRDGNGLNNQRDNLRLCGALGNARNTAAKGGSSRYKGVSWSKATRAWKVLICANRIKLYFGVFADEEFAARVHDAAVARYHGEYARLNFPDKPLLTEEEIATNRLLPFKTSRFRGVSWHAQIGRWSAKIQTKRKPIRLGCYGTEEEAARAYNAGALKYHGQKAKLNNV